MSVSPLPSEIQQWTIDEVGPYLEKVCFMGFFFWLFSTKLYYFKV